MPTFLPIANLTHCRARNTRTDDPRVAHVTIVIMLLLSSIVDVVSRWYSDVLGMFMVVNEENIHPLTRSQPK